MLSFPEIEKERIFLFTVTNQKFFIIKFSIQMVKTELVANFEIHIKILKT